MAFSKMTVGARLALCFGVLIGALSLVGGMGLARMSRMNEDLERVARKDWEKARLAMEIESRARDNARATAELFLVEGEAAARVRARMEENRSVVTRHMEELEKLLDLPEGKALHAKIKEARAVYVQSFGKVGKLLDNPTGRSEAVRLYQTETLPALEAFLGHVAKLVELQKGLMARTAEQSARDHAVARAAMVGTIVAALAAAALLAFFVVRALLRQLGGEPAYAAEVVSRVAAGDLTVEIRTRAGDETSLLAAMRRMVEALTGTVQRIKASADAVSAASQQIASGNADLSSRTEQQAASLEETASSMEELTATVKQNAENARQANQLAAGASEIAQKGGEMVSEVVATMQGISASSKKIADIIGVIDGIAFQTNILALNAAVEAARAGEQGRGFAVVASEVRNLAQRSAAAAKEIRQLIEDSVGRIEHGSALVERAGQTIAELVGAVKRVTDIMGEITAASQEQSGGIEQVNQAVMQMDQATQQNAALVEEAAAAAESLKEQARVLLEAVATFRLKETAQPAVATAAVVSEPRPAVKNVARLERKAAPKRPAPAAANEPARLKKAAGADDEWKEF
ncbi:MAG: methyl-accepting chemotaxis protein [Burkholderiales bacterium]|nr:methyl-accepting chemotaxis protein [Burkholderiales bacterium]